MEKRQKLNANERKKHYAQNMVFHFQHSSSWETATTTTERNVCMTKEELN